MQPLNGLAFAAEGIMLGLGAFSALALQTAAGATFMLLALKKSMSLQAIIGSIGKLIN